MLGTRNLRHILTLALVGCGWWAVQAAPAPKPESPADPLVRMKLTNAASLLRSDAVAKDVELSEEQTKKIDEIRKEAVEKQRKEMQRLGIAMPALPPAIAGGGVGNVGFADRMAELMANTPEVQKQVADLLKSEQVQRLKQIAIQAQGPSVLLDRRLIRALSLSAEQEDKIDALLADKAPLMLVGGLQLPDALLAQQAALVDKTWGEAFAILDADQKKNYEKIVGKKLATTDLLKIAPMTPASPLTPPLRLAPAPRVALPLVPVAPAVPIVPPAKEERKP